MVWKGNIGYDFDISKPEKSKGKENYGIWIKENGLVYIVLSIFDR